MGTPASWLSPADRDPGGCGRGAARPVSHRECHSQRGIIRFTDELIARVKAVGRDRCAPTGRGQKLGLGGMRDSARGAAPALL